MADDTNELWYKDAVIYELHVRAFCDSDGDGIGDFRGLASKLDYLKDLGVTALWILPFYPSPLRDDGYDISDYMGIHPSYGTLADFKFFLKEAHRRDMKVITELVLNHTSDQHEWFKRARKAPPGSKERNFYVWNDDFKKYKEARIIFKDYEASNWSWDPVAKAYYWHRFYSHQPDLNFENKEVKKALLEILDFWLGMGVDGLRLDAIPYLYEKEGTNCENLSETHNYLKSLRAYIDKKYKGKMLLAEANQWPEDAVEYFGKGDECHMAFHFPIMPRLFMAIHMEDRYPVVDILDQTPAIPDACQWAIFLRNHDELTLEMVTDEERDYMYRAYAHDRKARINLGIRRRLAPLLGNHRRKIELMNGLLFSLPGTPVMYYGDEIAMGDNIYLGDRNGVRTPMQWSSDRNAGFSRANPQQLFLPVMIDSQANVEAQQANPHSLLWWMKRLISLRKRSRAFGRGSIQFLSPENGKTLAFIRQFEDEKILVVANLSRYVQCVELDLSVYKGMIPVEMFGRTEFPPIGDLPYFITLGPHSFYWFTLEPARQLDEKQLMPGLKELAKIRVNGNWKKLFDASMREKLDTVLPEYIKKQRWFAGAAKKIKKCQIFEVIEVPCEPHDAYIALLRVEYTDAEPQVYQLPLTYASEGRAKEIQEQFSGAVLVCISTETKAGKEDGILYDALVEKNFSKTLLDGIRRRREFEGLEGSVCATVSPLFKKTKNTAVATDPEPSLIRAERNNTSVFYGNHFIFKFFRRLEEGVNPDLEMGRYLTEKTNFSNVPAVLGSLEYVKERSEPMTIGVLQSFVSNQGDAWKYTLDALAQYFERVLVFPDKSQVQLDLSKTPLELAQTEVSPLANEFIPPYLETARLLGMRVAELHVALAVSTDNADFDPEPFTPFYQRSLYQSLRNLANMVFQLLGKKCKNLPEAIQPLARAVLEKQADVLSRFHRILDGNIHAMRLRYHGDFHLGQVLYTGKDFIIIDFEGEPMRTLQDRRTKRSPLRDVAGMIRSLHYAAHTSLRSQVIDKVVRPEDAPELGDWADFWYLWSASSFLRNYLDIAKESIFIPKDNKELVLLLDLYILEKALYELNYELNHRPDWVEIPLKGILQMLGVKQ